MKKEIPTSTCLLFIIFLSSCTHYYYIPNVQNVPMFRQKGEARISSQLGGGDQTSTNEFHAAYAITINKLQEIVSSVSFFLIIRYIYSTLQPEDKLLYMDSDRSNLVLLRIDCVIL